MLQHAQQTIGIVIHRPHPHGREDRGKDTLEYAPVFQYVGDAGWTAQIVLQHVEAAIAISHQIGAGDVAPDSAWRIEPDARRAKRCGGAYKLRRDQAVLKYFLRVINVVDEQIQRRDTLLESALDEIPFRGRNDSGYEIERDDASVSSSAP